MKIAESRLRSLIKSIIVESAEYQLQSLDEEERKKLSELIEDTIYEFFDFETKDLIRNRFLKDKNDNRVKFQIGERRVTSSVSDILAGSYFQLISGDTGPSRYRYYKDIIEKTGPNGRGVIFKEVAKEIKKHFPKLSVGVYDESNPYSGFHESSDDWHALSTNQQEEFCNRIVDNVYSVYDVIDS